MKTKNERPWPLRPEGNSVCIEEMSKSEFTNWKDTDILIKSKEFGDNMPKGIVKALSPQYKGSAKVGDVVVYRGGGDSLMYNKLFYHRVFEMDIIFVLGVEAIEEAETAKVNIAADMSFVPAVHDDLGNIKSERRQKK